MSNSVTATIPADDRAHHIAQSIAAIIEELAQGGSADRAIAMAKDVQASAEQLCDDLDPCNPHGSVAPLFPDVLGAAKLAVSYGVNVVPFVSR